MRVAGINSTPRSPCTCSRIQRPPQPFQDPLLCCKVLCQSLFCQNRFRFLFPCPLLPSKCCPLLSWSRYLQVDGPWVSAAPSHTPQCSWARPWGEAAVEITAGNPAPRKAPQTQPTWLGAPDPSGPARRRLAAPWWARRTRSEQCSVLHEETKAGLLKKQDN